MKRLSTARAVTGSPPLASWTLRLRESIYITCADSIYRSYSVFHGRIPFVSPVRALIIPRTFLAASSSPKPLSLSFILSHTFSLESGGASQTAAGGRDSILVARRDNNREVAS